MLTQQAERLQDTLAQIEQQHVEQLAAKDSAHLQQLQDIRSELEQRQQEWVGAACRVSTCPRLWYPGHKPLMDGLSLTVYCSTEHHC